MKLPQTWVIKPRTKCRKCIGTGHPASCAAAATEWVLSNGTSWISQPSLPRIRGAEPIFYPPQKILNLHFGKRKPFLLNLPRVEEGTLERSNRKGVFGIETNSQNCRCILFSFSALLFQLFFFSSIQLFAIIQLLVFVFLTSHVYPTVVTRPLGFSPYWRRAHLHYSVRLMRRGWDLKKLLETFGVRVINF